MAAERGGPQLIPRPAGWRPGNPPPWAAHVGTDPRLHPATIRDALAASTVERSMALVPPGIRRSAVAVILSSLVPESDDGPETEILLTRRSWNMRTHRGEVSFAGGAEDPGDDFPVGTAAREAFEEVGVGAGLIEPVGALDPLTTFTSDRVVVPVVLLTSSRPDVVLEPAEVDAVLHVPLRELLHPDCYHQELWSWGDDVETTAGSDVRLRAASDHPMHFFDLHGDTVWGATAAMLHQLLGVLLAPRS